MFREPVILKAVFGTLNLEAAAPLSTPLFEYTVTFILFSPDEISAGSVKLNDLGDSSNTYTLVNHVATVVWHGNSYTLTEQNLGAQVVLTDLNGDGSTSGIPIY